MKYQCDNCQFCCISSSPSVSYCGLASECSSTPLANSSSLGFAFLSLVFFAFALLALYYRFRNRSLKLRQQPAIKIQSERIQAPPAPKKEEVKMQAETGGKGKRESKVNKSRISSRYSKFSIPSTMKTDTDRRLK